MYCYSSSGCDTFRYTHENVCRRPLDSSCFSPCLMVSGVYLLLYDVPHHLRQILYFVLRIQGVLYSAAAVKVLEVSLKKKKNALAKESPDYSNQKYVKKSKSSRGANRYSKINSDTRQCMCVRVMRCNINTEENSALGV